MILPFLKSFLMPYYLFRVVPNFNTPLVPLSVLVLLFLSFVIGNHSIFVFENLREHISK